MTTRMGRLGLKASLAVGLRVDGTAERARLLTLLECHPRRRRAGLRVDFRDQ